MMSFFENSHSRCVFGPLGFFSVLFPVHLRRLSLVFCGSSYNDPHLFPLGPVPLATPPLFSFIYLPTRLLELPVFRWLGVLYSGAVRIRSGECTVFPLFPNRMSFPLSFGLDWISPLGPPARWSFVQTTLYVPPSVCPLCMVRLGFSLFSPYFDFV